MRSEFNKIDGRIGVVAAIVLALAALVLYLYSQRAMPPEPGLEAPSKAESDVGSAKPVSFESTRPEQAPAGAAAYGPVEADGEPSGPDAPRSSRAAQPETIPEPELSLDRQQQLLREDLTVRLGPGQLELIVEERLLERLVTTVNSLDGAPVPLRFRPLAHVPGLPRLARDGEDWQLPETSDPRYRNYRALFDRLDAVEMAELFDRYEPALEKAWQALGEHSGQTFRQRSIEILEHLAEFDLPASRPALHQPKVLYEYIDPLLEQLSWGRKILVRIGPEHASPVQHKLAVLAERLARRSRKTGEESIP